jgi:bacillithiol synthase
LGSVSSHSDATASPGAVRAAIDLGRLPWIRPLAPAYANDFSSVAGLFAGNPADPASWRDAIRRAQQAPRDAARLQAILLRQLSERDAPPEARAAAATLADSATVAIVTGQQAGLFGGPLYTVLKAITAIQVARRVEREYGVVAVPVFWVEGEDHDWDEVRGATVLDADLVPRTVTLDAPDGAGLKPVAALVPGDRIAPALASLEQALAPTDFTADLMASLRRCYRPGTTMAAAFACWLDDLLGRHGLVVFDAADPEAKPLAADLFTRELQHPSETGELVRAAAAEMTRLGHAPQVEPAADAVALFYLDAAGRHPIRWRGGTYLIGTVTRTAADLAAEAADHPERFSPNVLLRPLVQDRLLPTVCFVAGPNELAYQAQLGGVYRAFGVERPLLYPRATVTLVDSAAARFLDRAHLPLETLQPQDEAALNAFLAHHLPPTVDRALDEAGQAVAAQIGRLREAVVPIDATLAGAVDTTLARMQDTLHTLQSKIVRATKRKDETLRRQFQRTRSLVFPDGHPQERAVCVVFFLNMYGRALVDRLLEALPVDTGRHYVLAL